MKDSVQQLTPKEREALALWYDSASYKALLRLAEVDVAGLAADALNAPNLEQVKYLKGRADWAVDIFKLLQENYRKSQKG